MPYTAYDTRELHEAVEETARPGSFLLDNFFNELEEFPTESIDFDVITEETELAPFVSPLVAGKAQRDDGFITKSFKPAYVKPKNPVEPHSALKRRPGEPYNGNMTPAQRFELNTMDILLSHRNQILRRKEWMAAQALVTGQVVVEGENYPQKVVDFGRDASLTKTLAGNDVWTDAASTPLDNIEQWALDVQNVSGDSPTDVVFTPDSWKLFKDREDFRDILDNRRQATGNVELGPTVRGEDNHYARYMGTTGDFNFWVYQQFFKLNGVTGQMLPNNTVLLVGQRLKGKQCHGAILDSQFLIPLEYAPKVWEEQDPPVRMAMTQSAPLMVPCNVNACLSATVA